MRKRKGPIAGVLAGMGVMGLLVLSLGTPDGCGSSSEEVIGRDGGTVISDDGLLMLDVPEGALKSDVEISVYPVDCEQPNEMGCYELSPHGLVFHQPAIATYEAGDLMAMDNLNLSVMGEDGWQPMADQFVDVDDETVTASVLFSSSVCITAQ